MIVPGEGAGLIDEDRVCSLSFIPRVRAGYACLGPLRRSNGAEGSQNRQAATYLFEMGFNFLLCRTEAVKNYFLFLVV